MHDRESSTSAFNGQTSKCFLEDDTAMQNRFMLDHHRTPPRPRLARWALSQPPEPSYMLQETLRESPRVDCLQNLSSPKQDSSYPRHSNQYSDVEDEDDDTDEEDEPESAIPNVRTFVRSEAPQDLVRHNSLASARGVKIDIILNSSFHCGGGVIKGNLVLQYNSKAKKNRNTQISSVKLDCLGVESVSGHEPKLFFTVAQDILTTGIYLHDLNKMFLQEDHVQAGQCFIPFEVQLPLDVGPGTFETKEAEIEYKIVASLTIENSRKFPEGRLLRLSRKVMLYPCLDPSRALVPASAPIDAVEEGKIRFGGKSTLKVAARIHRPSWIAGQVAYVDVSIVNDSGRDTNKIQLELIRHIAFYKNSAASSAFHTVDHRIPEKVISKTISNSVLIAKSGRNGESEWSGVKAGTRGGNTVQLFVPCGQLSVSAGRYFDARYVIKVSVGCARGGEVQLELPITVIHINSLDVIPSSLRAVSRMIATYAEPAVPEQSPSSKSRGARTPTEEPRRASMPAFFGNTMAGFSNETSDRSAKPIQASSARTDSNGFASGVTERGIGSSTYYTEPKDKRQPSINISGSPLASQGAKPGIQCDLRRALSLDYQSRFSKLDISSERASYTRGAPLAKRSPDRRRRDLSENLAHRLHRERTKNPSFYDVV